MHGDIRAETSRDPYGSKCEAKAEDGEEMAHQKEVAEAGWQAEFLAVTRTDIAFSSKCN